MSVLSRPLSTPFCPLDEVMRLVEPADTGGHWYWLGETALVGLDAVPVIRQDAKTWDVLDILLPVSRGLFRVNRCGLRTCVRPDHWHLCEARRHATLTDFDGRGWKLA